MAMSRRYKILFLVVFLVSLLLRLGLTLVNREANDSHMEVVSIILKTNESANNARLRGMYSTKTIPLHGGHGHQSTWTGSSGCKHIMAGGTVDKFVAGMITLVIVWLFHNKHPLQE